MKVMISTVLVITNSKSNDIHDTNDDELNNRYNNNNNNLTHG